MIRTAKRRVPETETADRFLLRVFVPGDFGSATGGSNLRSQIRHVRHTLQEAAVEGPVIPICLFVVMSRLEPRHHSVETPLLCGAETEPKVKHQDGQNSFSGDPAGNLFVMLVKELLIGQLSHRHIQLALDLRNDWHVLSIPGKREIERDYAWQCCVRNLFCPLADVFFKLRKGLHALGRDAELGAFDGAGDVRFGAVNG